MKDKRYMSAVLAAAAICTNAAVYPICAQEPTEEEAPILLAAEAEHTLTFTVTKGMTEEGFKPELPAAMTGTEITLPAAPTLESSKFIGWTIFKNASDKTGELKKAGEKITLTGDWTAVPTYMFKKTRQIFIQKEDCSGYKKAFEQTVDRDQSFTGLPEIPTATHKKNEEKSKSTESKLYQDVEIIEYFDVDTGTLAFDNKGAVGGPSEISAKFFTEITLPKAGTLAGSTFQGWKINGKTYQPGDKIKLTENMLAVAQYSETLGSVTYTYWIGHDGAYEIAAQGTATEFINKTFKAPERTFNYYTLNKAKSTMEGTVTEKGLDLNIYYDAVAIPVNFDLNGGTRPTGVTYPTKAYLNDIISVSQLPTRSGYELTGWTINGVKHYQIFDLAVNDEIMNAGKLTIKAEWEKSSNSTTNYTANTNGTSSSSTGTSSSTSSSKTTLTPANGTLAKSSASVSTSAQSSMPLFAAVFAAGAAGLLAAMKKLAGSKNAR